MMKVLFINAINPHIEQEKRYPNLGLGYLASYLRQHFGNDYFQFKIIDCNIEKSIDDFMPAIVCITATSQNFTLAKKYASAVKLRCLPVIIGGSHISALPQTLPKNIDVGVIGEGELTIVDIFKLFIKKNFFVSNDLSKIEGIVYWDRNKLFITSERKPIEPLDNIPFPARDLLKVGKHAHIISSRGCPYKCVFCSSSHFWGRARYFSAEYVVEEIKELVFKYKVTLISFYDELMMADKERLKKIIELLKQNDIIGKIKFTINARSNLINEDVVSLFKEMNVVSVFMGLESGSQRVLRYLKGNNVTVIEGINAIKLLKVSNIAVSATFIIGSPNESEAEILQTLKFIKSNRLDLVDVYVLTPFPGTPIWDYAKEQGLVSDNMEWELLNQYYFSSHKEGVVLSNTISKNRLHKLYCNFRIVAFWLNLKNILRNPFVIEIPRMLINKAFEKSKRVLLIN